MLGTVSTLRGVLDLVEYDTMIVVFFVLVLKILGS